MRSKVPRAPAKMTLTKPPPADPRGPREHAASLRFCQKCMFIPCNSNIQASFRPFFIYHQTSITDSPLSDLDSRWKTSAEPAPDCGKQTLNAKSLQVNQRQPIAAAHEEHASWPQHIPRTHQVPAWPAPRPRTTSATSSPVPWPHFARYRVFTYLLAGNLH